MKNRLKQCSSEHEILTLRNSKLYTTDIQKATLKSLDSSPGKLIPVSPFQYLPGSNGNSIIFTEESKSVNGFKKPSYKDFKQQPKQKSSNTNEVKVVNLKLPFIDKSKAFMNSFNLFKKGFSTSNKILHEPSNKISYQSIYLQTFYKPKTYINEKSGSTHLYNFLRL